MKTIKKVLVRLQEIHKEKEPFLAKKPLMAIENLKLFSIIEFRKYGDLCKEEEKLIKKLEKLES